MTYNPFESHTDDESSETPSTTGAQLKRLLKTNSYTAQSLALVGVIGVAFIGVTLGSTGLFLNKLEARRQQAADQENATTHHAVGTILTKNQDGGDLYYPMVDSKSNVSIAYTYVEKTQFISVQTSVQEAPLTFPVDEAIFDSLKVGQQVGFIYYRGGNSRKIIGTQLDPVLVASPRNTLR